MALRKQTLRLIYIIVTPAKNIRFWQHSVSTMHYLIPIKVQNFK